MSEEVGAFRLEDFIKTRADKYSQSLESFIKVNCDKAATQIACNIDFMMINQDRLLRIKVPKSFRVSSDGTENQSKLIQKSWIKYSRLIGKCDPEIRPIAILLEQEIFDCEIDELFLDRILELAF